MVILNYFTFLENLTLDIQAFKAKIPLIEQYKKSHISKDKITQSDLEDVESFSLNCLGLESIPLSSSVQNLKTIDLSCNHLKSFDFVQYMPNLERLVLISNRIELVSTRTAGLKRIEYIDLSFNGIRDANQFKSMNQLHSLKHLLLRGNPLIFRTPNYFDQIIPHLPSLKYLDEKPVDEQRKKLSSSPFRTLDAELVAKEQSKTSEGGPCTIKLNHMKLIGISINTNFADLQNLDISNNNLTKLDGLQFFPRLTHLKAENNLLTDITDVGHLLHLRILELGSNCISNPGHSLTGLKELTLLSMDRNKIRSLASFTELSVLLELYLGENLIEDLKEVRNLGSLKKLVVLDLLGNPMCRDAEYRLFCVFNIKEIKVLDGNNVVQKEFEDSKQAFMGKLSDELLAERLRGRNMQTLVSMDLSHCNLRDFDNIFTSQKFPKIVEMDLTGNHFTNLRCFGYLPTLKELSLAENKLTSLETGTDPKVKIGLYGLPVSFGYTES